MTAPRPQVSVIIVNYETSAMVRRCVGSLANQDIPHEIIVVDNPSPAADVRHLNDLPVRLVQNTENLGYGRGCNAGAAIARGDLICVLNPDTIVPDGALAAWVASLRACQSAGRRVGLLAPRLVNENGTVQRSTYQFVNPLNYWLYHSLLAGVLKRMRKTFRLPDTISAGRVRRTDWVMGAALLLPRVAWEAVGGFSDKYFLYSEDTDLCRRLWLSGWEVLFDPSVTLIHTQGEASAESRDRAVLRFFTGLSVFLHTHYGPARRRAVEVAVILDMLMRLAILLPIVAARPSRLIMRNRLRGYWSVLKMYGRLLTSRRVSTPLASGRD
ncbi:MAG: glycosyltransferase family 2 protein [Candidatus Sumerlaeaceae bacterium]|nr:glycosyltransferase family 2 protein [Candidatus Sumerlaeaceae bacterium]